MSWSLQVSNGDLVLSGMSFGTVSNEAKLFQDFRHHLLTRMGTDGSYPWYGSLIDGGRKPSGQEVESLITTTDFPTASLRIEAEIRRIAAQYQKMQLDRAQADRDRYNKSTLTMGEVLAAVLDVDFQQTADALSVRITIQSGRDNVGTVDLTLPPIFSR